MLAEIRDPGKKLGIKIVVLILAALLLGGATEYFTNNTMYRYISGNHQREILTGELTSDGYNTANGVTVSAKADANFVTKVNQYVHCVTVHFNEKLKTDLPIQAYYTMGKEGYNEKQSVRIVVKAGKNEGTAVLQKPVKMLRVDIGDNSGDTFALDRLIVNEKQLVTPDNLGVREAELQNVAIRGTIYAILFAFLLLHVLMGPKRLYDVVYRYRYAIGGAVIVLATAVGLSGSSIGAMADHVGTENYTVWGSVRLIRTDEWALNTQMALSQCATGFHYFADAFRATPTDMFMVYGQPVWTFAEIFRPFHWGYLLLGATRGLAFFWTARVVFLLLVSFDFGMLLTNRKKGLSLAYSLMITLSPLLQWWIDVNGLVEMLLFAQLALIFFDKYLRSNQSKVRLALAAGIAWCAGGYILTLYPSWQVPVAYIILGCIVWLIWENWGNIHLSKKDMAGIAGVLVVFGALIASVMLKSSDTIKLVMGSQYPGHRTLLGGSLKDLISCMSYPASIFYPITQNDLPTNVCELSRFYDFFPLGNILAVYLLVTSKTKDKILCCVGVADIILGLWCTFKWPAILAKVSLLSMSQSGRAVLGFEICNIILLLRGISLLAERKEASRKLSITVSFIAALLLSVATTLITQNSMPKYMTLERTIIAGVVVFVAAFLLLQYERCKVLTTVVVVALMLSMGLLVNPLQCGLNVIYQSGVYQKVKALEDKEPGKWLVEDDVYLTNLPTIAGASTVNATSTYPNLTYWKRFDEAGKNQKIYNRYAWIVGNIVEGDTSFKLTAPDQFQVHIGVADLPKSEISYVLATSDLSGLGNGTFTKIYDDKKCKIYKVNHQ